MRSEERGSTETVAAATSTKDASDKDATTAALKGILQHLQQKKKATSSHIGMAEISKQESPHPVGDADSDEWTVISLCDGIGCAAMTLANLKIPVDKYYAFETDKTAKAIGDFANPKTDTFPGITRLQCDDIRDITKQHVKEMVAGKKRVLLPAGIPCVHLSKLKDRVGATGWQPPPDNRKGLAGDGLFDVFVQIYEWILEFCPNVKYFLENVDFSDMKDDWQKVTDIFGEATIINATHHSYTHRKRDDSRRSEGE